MKTTNQLLATVCRVRQDRDDSEHETCAFPFSRKTEDGEADIATNGHVLVAVMGRGAHYSLTQGPPLKDVFVRDAGSFVAIRGARVAISTSGLRSWCRDAPKVEAGGKTTRPMYLVAEQDPAHHVVVDADHLASVLAFLKGDAVLVIGPHTAGLPSLDVVGVVGDALWDGCVGRVRALVMPMRADVTETMPKVMLLPPPEPLASLASAL